MARPKKNDVALIEMDGHPVDVQALAQMIFKKSNKYEKCPVCVCDKDQFASLHNDAVKYGYNDYEFTKKWTLEFPLEVIKSHFQHHYVFSDMVEIFQSERRKIRKNDIESDSNFIDESLVQMIVSGNYNKAYAELVSDLIMVKDVQRKQFVTQIEKIKEGEESRNLTKTGLDFRDTVSGLGDFLMKIDRLQHHKAYKTIHSYLESLRTGLMQDVMSEINKTFNGMKDSLSLRFGGEEKTVEFLEPFVVQMRERLAAAYLKHREDADRKWQDGE